MSEKIRSMAAGVVCLCLGATAANAHPHVWIANWADVVFNDEGKIIALNIQWKFDENYSAIAIEGLDTDQDGFYSAAELEPLARENIKALADYSYFTYVQVDGKKVEYKPVTEYGQIHSGKILKMHFQIPLKEPVDPKTQTFGFKVYDPSFYIAIEYPEEKPLTAIGAMPKNCKVELSELSSDEKTEETRQMLSTKDQDWQPDPDEEFGAMFAQPAFVVCGPKTAMK